MFEQITIIAPGLLGGSLLAALQKRHIANRLAVWARRQEIRELCLARGWCELAPEKVEEALREAQLVVFCTPVDVSLQLLPELIPFIPEDAMITDVGSTKKSITERAQPLHARYVGSHPMAGSDKKGLEHADSDLFEGRPCFVTPCPETDQSVTETIRNVWHEVGMHTYEMNPSEHDEVIATLSHVPHLAASALANTLGNVPFHLRNWGGQGWLDTTRVAGGDPDLWRSILMDNQEAVSTGLEALIHELKEFKNILDASDAQSLLDSLGKAQALRYESEQTGGLPPSEPS